MLFRVNQPNIQGCAVYRLREVSLAVPQAVCKRDPGGRVANYKVQLHHDLTRCCREGIPPVLPQSIRNRNVLKMRLLFSDYQHSPTTFTFLASSQWFFFNKRKFLVKFWCIQMVNLSYRY